MYLPAFAELATALNTSTAKVGLSVSSYFIGLAFGQLFYGPLLDRFGRKKPLAVGLGVYVLATIGCIYSLSIEALIGYRFIQALGGCVAMVASLAMVRDFFSEHESAKVFSLLVLIIGVSPLLAPTVGGFVVASFGWQAVFWMLGLNVLAVIALFWLFLPEAHEPDPSISLRPQAIVAGFREVFRHPQFRLYAVTGALSFAGLFAYVAGSPAIFMSHYKIDAKSYGLIFAGLSVGFIGSSQLNIWLLKYFSNASLFRAAIFTQTATGALFLLVTLTGWMPIQLLLVFMFVFLSCLGIANPNASSLALSPFSKNAGSAAALLGLLQMGIGALNSSVVGILDFPGVLTTVISLSGSAILAGLYYIYQSRHTATSQRCDLPRS